MSTRQVPAAPACRLRTHGVYLPTFHAFLLSGSVHADKHIAFAQEALEALEAFDRSLGESRQTGLITS
ncbi:hypothetical protein AB0I22_13640 [Streptomyces sp. NPDC050610]|uniref:hypothetical protein n=1 Tax=Streptomyces sp. NPDC050610 TaxID=3157097 RepID=UPI0034350A08